MNRPSVTSHCRKTRRLSLLALALAAGLAVVAGIEAAPPLRPGRFGAFQQPEAPPAPRSALLKAEDWQKAALTPIQPGEIDDLIGRELRQSKIEPAARTTDEQFIRRATLDLTGQLPSPRELREFVANSSPDKRARLIDRLLDSDAYARHWARYWRDVVTARLPDQRFLIFAQGFEQWMEKELRANRSWGEIARAMITADGQLRFDRPGENGAAYFLASHRGQDAPIEQAGEVSRVFLGIQIQCAQCHDHPSDQWKRVQFHELAGYFARLRQRPVREDGMMAGPARLDKNKKPAQQARIVGVELVSLRFGEHRMPAKDDPRKLLLTLPRFLDGRSPGRNLSDLERRRALARDITNPSNYWFAAAFVNRTWGALMGQSFYEPVDDMGPQKQAVFPGVLTRLAGSFRGSRYDVKRLFRDVMNTETYQRQIRLSEATEHLHFAAVYPARLPADALWQALTNVLGEFTPPRAALLARPMLARRAFLFGLPAMFQQEFAFDPSQPAGEVEGSLTQALLLMNNPQINNRMQARGPTVLARILRDNPRDEDAIRQLYVRTLARKPTDREVERGLAYIGKVGKRAEAYEDLLWALVNSAEFQTKR